MKGIKKLIFGLLVTTIVGISFHSEAKAAVTGNYDPTTQSLKFETNGLSGTETFNLTTNEGDSCSITWDSTSSAWIDDSGMSITFGTNSLGAFDITLDKAGILSCFGVATESEFKNITFTLSDGGIDSKDVEVGAECPELVIVDTDDNPISGISYAHLNDWYLKGDKYTFTLSGDTSHCFFNWSSSGYGSNSYYEYTSDGTSSEKKVVVDYDSITGFEIDRVFDKRLCVGKTSLPRNIDGFTSKHSPSTWTLSEITSLPNWELSCGNGATINGSNPFTIIPATDDNFTIVASAKGLVTPGEIGQVEVATFSSSVAPTIELAPMPINVTVGGKVEVEIKTTGYVDYSTLLFAPETDASYYAKFIEGNTKIQINGLKQNSNSTIRVYTAYEGLEPSGGAVSSIEVPVNVVAPGFSYSLVPGVEINVEVDDIADINFDEIIYSKDGFDPTDDLTWIIPSPYSDIAELIPKSGKGANVQVRGKKAGTAKVYLKVEKGEKAFPASKDIANYYVNINVVDKPKGDPSYVLYDDAVVNVKVGEKVELEYDSLISREINYDPEVDEITWVIPPAYEEYAKILQSEGFMVKGLKEGKAKAYLKIITKDGRKFPKTSTVASKYLITINVKKNGSPSPTPGGDDLKLSDPVDLTVGYKDKLVTFVTSGDTSAEVSVEYNSGAIEVSSEPTGSYKLKDIVLTAKNNTSKSAIVVDDGETEATSQVIVYPKVSVSKDSSGKIEFKIPKRANTGNSSSHITTSAALVEAKCGSNVYTMSGSSWGTSNSDNGVSLSSSNDEYTYSFSLSSSDLKSLGKQILKDNGGGSSITIAACPVGTVFGGSQKGKNTEVAGSVTLNVYKVTLSEDGGAKYTVDGESVSGSFYAIEGVPYTIASSAKNSGATFKKWESGESTSATITDYKFSSSKTLKAIYESSSSSSSSSSSKPSSSTTPSSTAKGGNQSGGRDYDDVPRTGESKADIWILWSVLLLSILGAGYMIYRRFGLVSAIAQVEAEEGFDSYEAVDVVETQETEQQKDDKLQMLRDLRNIDE